MKKSKFALLFSIIIFSIWVLFLLFSSYNHFNEKGHINYLSERSMEVSSKNLTQEITIAAIGDILIHDRVYIDAKEGNSYNFDKMLEKVTPALKKPDILVANEETIVAGESIGLSGYPAFNGPVEIADSIKKAGVDIVTTANNHSLDRGVEAQKLSLQNLDDIKLPHVGTFMNEEDQQQLRILSSNGIKVAFLSYTYGLNGIPIPKGKEYIVNMIDFDKMKKEINRAKKEADLIVMGIHWGMEYERFPSIEQRDIAKFLVDEGVDIIFGSHPHVLQPAEWLEGKDGNKSLVVYSLGNFLSGQDEQYRDLGGMVSVRVQKSWENNKTKITLLDPSFYPTFVASEAEKNYKMEPLLDSEKAKKKYSETIYDDMMNHVLNSLEH
ncbi:MAG TPA: CapA family protein [Niallia sp.]|nr:CapA family protein [Niallia sp.]